MTLFRTFSFTPQERMIFAKKEDLTPSQWAEKYRIVPIGAHKGPWRNEISPHLVKIMDTWALPYVREVIICKSPQTGGTETIFNCMAYAMDRDPSTMMLIMPSETQAKRTMADRIIPMILNSPRLQNLISPDPDDMAKMRIKLMNGTILYTAWANSPTALASFPIKYLFFDEIDKYPISLGKEADPISLGEKRAITFSTYKIFKVSSPTVVEGHIWQAFQKADVQFKYSVRCPSCDKEHIMSLDHLKWPDDISPEQIRLYQLAWYECPFCHARWTDLVKQKAVRLGSWVRTKGQDILRPRSVAFHLPAWISPDVTLSEIASAYLMSKNNRIKLIDFYNAYLAEPYIEELSGDTVREELLYNRRYQYWPDGAQWRIPMQACVLTCAVDVQASPGRLEAEVVAWGEGYESWGIEYRVFPGDPAQMQVWQDLEEFLSREWLHESGAKLRIAATAIDAGYLTPIVYNFVRKHQARRVYAVKGSNVRGKPLLSFSTSRKARQKGVLLYIIGTEIAKDMLFEWMAIDSPGPGYMHYHLGYDFNYFRQLTSEIAVTLYDKSGRPYREWRKKSSDIRSEALDLRVYNLAALEILNPNFSLLKQNLLSQKIELQPKTQRLVRKRSWVKGWK